MGLRSETLLQEVVLETVIKKRRLVGKRVDMFQAVRKHTDDHEGEMRWRKKGREGGGGGVREMGQSHGLKHRCEFGCA